MTDSFRSCELGRHTLLISWSGIDAKYLYNWQIRGELPLIGEETNVTVNSVIHVY